MRHEVLFPASEYDMIGTLTNMWANGWFDEFSDEHFLIKVFENRLTQFEWETQFLNNNCNSMYSSINSSQTVDYSSLSKNFIINLSGRFKGLIKLFGEKAIKRFVIEQLSAGKENYNINTFFQALSEIEILCFFGSKNPISTRYEPPVSINSDANPEASFVYEIHTDSGEKKRIKVNVEVKTPKFPSITQRDKPLLLPTLLLNDKGRMEFTKICKDNNIEPLMPRVTKLVEFINSASRKFLIPQQDEYNLLYINWSYSDYPIAGFIEAWNLLANDKNGLLVHPEIATKLPFKEPVVSDAYSKITAVIVYSSSVDQLMFMDFRHVWERIENFNHKFRMYVLDSKLREDELRKCSHSLLDITGMRPDINDGEWKILGDLTNATSIDDKIKTRAIATCLFELIEKEYLR